MDTNNCKSTLARYIAAYLWTILLAIYLTKETGGHPPAWLATLALSGAGLGLSVIFLLLAGKDSVSSAQAWLFFSLFQILQGGLGFVIERYVFNVTLFSSLTYSIGALTGLLLFWVSRRGTPRLLSNLVGVAFIAVSFAIVLRLSSVVGGIYYGIAILNSFWLARRLLKKETEETFSIESLTLAAVLLVTGRAIIYHYLAESGYLHLGVVISTPYTFAALFTGLFLPIAFSQVEKENYLPPIVWVILWGGLFPFVAGIFVHARPMGGYLLGLVVSSFLCATLLSRSFYLHLLTYLSFIVTVASLPLFQKFLVLTRKARLGILGGCLLVVLLIFLLIRTRSANQTATV